MHNIAETKNYNPNKNQIRVMIQIYHYPLVYEKIYAQTIPKKKKNRATNKLKMINVNVFN